MDYNRIKIDGTWYHIPDLEEYALSVVTRENYSKVGNLDCDLSDQYHVYQIRFGNVILELQPRQAIGLGVLLTVGTADGTV